MPEAVAVAALKLLLAHPGTDPTALLNRLNGDDLTKLAIACEGLASSVNRIRSTRPEPVRVPDPEWDDCGGYFEREE